MSPDIQQLPPTTTYPRLAFAWRFLLVFVLVNLVVWLVAYSLYYVERRDSEASFRQRQTMLVAVQKDTISQRLNRFAGDILYWSRQIELSHIPEMNDHTWNRMIGQEYVAFLKSTSLYDQIRFIDTSGMEVVRVMYADGYPYQVPDRTLQSLKDRFFFRDTMRLQRDEVYVSPMELAAVEGEAMLPFKPVIRIATPVFDDRGAKRGIIVLTYRAQNLLAEIGRMASLSASQVWLVDSDGYFLMSDNQEDMWGFVIKGRGDRKLGVLYPDVWEAMKPRAAGQYRNSSGLYTFGTVYPYRSDIKTIDRTGNPRGVGRDQYSSEVYHWKLVTFVPDALLSAGPRRLLNKMIIIWLVLVVVISGMSWLVLAAYMRRKIFQRNIYLYAHYDTLTGLPNRMLFFDRLEQALLQARRYEKPFGLLYMDLDGFKEINDSFGHKIGDLGLQEAARRMVGTLRESDTVARMGGDEFVALLTNVTSQDDIEYVTRRLVDILAQPYELNGYTCSMSVSIGVAICPNHGLDSTVLVAEADNAMYRSKQAGKNTYRFADGSMAAKENATVG